MVKKSIIGVNWNLKYRLKIENLEHQVDDLKLDLSALNHIQLLNREVSEQSIRTYLGGFNFKGDKVNDSVNLFSGGEKARLALAMIAFQRPNLLLMDEPTNHLDMDMRQALTIALQSFGASRIVFKATHSSSASSIASLSSS